MKTNLNAIINKIKVVVFDVDGVLTNGKIVLDSKGEELKFFDVKDGFGISLLRKAGIKTAILTARYAPAVEARAKDLKIDKAYQDVYPKLEGFYQLLKDFNVKPQEVCFVGDDLPDVCVLREVGFAVAVNDAVLEAKKEADYITKKNGGAGAVRETIELILKTQNKLKELTEAICQGKK